MEPTADELAGVVELFGGLTRGELTDALAEAAFRATGNEIDDAAVDAAIASAEESFALLAVTPSVIDGDEPPAERLLVAGPTAFPTVPEAAEDVPYILEVERRQLDRSALAARARAEFTTAVSAALEAGDSARCRELLEVSYDLETWAPVDVTDERRRLTEDLE